MGKITLANNKMKYSRELHDDEYQLEKVFGKKPELLTSKMITMGAQQSDWYPMLLETEGKRKVKYIKGIDYSYPVIDSTRRGAINILKSEFTAGEKVGEGGTSFEFVVDDVLIVNYTYILKDDIEIYCTDVVEQGENWKGTFKLMDGTDLASYVPGEYIAENSRISTGVGVVSMAASRGNGSTYATPYQKKNMINMFRKTYKTEGEVAKAVVTFTYTKNDGTSNNLWMDFRKWQFRQEWNYEKEIGLWYGKYNKRPDGVIPIKDPKSGYPAQRGSGIFEQIVNKQSYSFLSAKFLQDIIMQLFRGISGQTKKEITLYTGTLGRRFFSDAMESLLLSKAFTIDASLAVSGKPGELEYNYGFSSFVTIDGHRVRVKTHPMFDDGPGADVADVYSGDLTTESARMIFLDTTSYDGEANIQMVIQEGWDEKKQKVAGVGSDTEGITNPLVSSDIHASSEEYMTRRGIEILKANCCLDMTFKMAA